MARETEVLDARRLEELAGHDGWPKASMTMPASRETIANGQDQIRLRNLAGKAAEELVAGGLRRPAAEALLAPVLEAGQSGGAMWTGGFAGLALFVGEGLLETVRLDVPLPESVVVGDRFYLRPLYAAVRTRRPFWALAVDREGTRLFHGSEAGIAQVALPDGTPTSVEDETSRDERGGEQLQFRSIPTHPPVAGRGPAAFHGHANEKDLDKVALQRFMTHLDNGVTKTIGRGRNEPLVLIGLDHETAAYRAASTYADLVPQRAQADSHLLSEADVLRLALEALAPMREREEQADLAELEEKRGTSLASESAAEIVAAAAQGRVKTLFVGDAAGPWGTFDRETFSVSEACPAQPRYLRQDARAAGEAGRSECGWDLVDLAAAETLRTDGRIRAFAGEGAPVRSVAAVFRY